MLLSSWSCRSEWREKYEERVSSPWFIALLVLDNFFLNITIHYLFKNL